MDEAPKPFVREQGTGPTVLCVHANASHSGQWRHLMDQLAGAFHVVAVDSWGSGRTQDWPSDREIQLADEVRLIEPLITGSPAPVHLVGHSYGAGVALKAALQFQERIGRVALFEPTIFALVHRKQPQDVDGIQQAVRGSVDCLERGDVDGAGRVFIDFWMGAGSWDRMPPDRRRPMAESVRNVRRWAHALMTEPATADDMRALDRPVLVMTGGRSPLSSRSVARELLALLPRVRHVEFPELGHMGALTHPEVVDAEIERFLLER